MRRTLLVVALPEGMEANEAGLERFTKATQDRLGPDYDVLVLPPGCTAKAFPSGACYQREKLKEYEYEILAESEEALKARVAALCGCTPTFRFSGWKQPNAAQTWEDFDVALLAEQAKGPTNATTKLGTAYLWLVPSNLGHCCECWLLPKEYLFLNEAERRWYSDPPKGFYIHERFSIPMEQVMEVTRAGMR